MVDITFTSKALQYHWYLGEKEGFLFSCFWAITAASGHNEGIVWLINNNHYYGAGISIYSYPECHGEIYYYD